MNQFFLSAFLSLTAGLSLPAQAILERAAAHYSDGSAHEASFVQTYTPAGFTGTRREAGSLWIQAPQRLRFDYTAPEKKTFTYDSGEGRLFAPEDRQLTVRKLTAEERARLPIVFLSDPGELARQYKMSVETGGAGQTRVMFKPLAAGVDLTWLSVSIDRDGSVNALAYEDSSGNRSEFRFEGWRREKPRPASDYRITGPPGTSVLEN